MAFVEITGFKEFANTSMERFVFLLTLDINGIPKQCILKIAAGYEEYIIEQKIYEQLTKDLKSNKQYKDNIIKYYGGEIFDQLRNQYTLNSSFGKIVITNSDNGTIFHKISKVIFESGKAVYTFLEYDSNYKPLLKMYDEIEHIKKTVFRNIIDTILFLKIKFDFNHFDLHHDNILVNGKGKIKLFDFDFSSTKKNQNNKFINMFSNSFKEMSMDISTFGFVYDIFRFCIEQYNKFNFFSQDQDVNKAAQKYHSKINEYCRQDDQFYKSNHKFKIYIKIVIEMNEDVELMEHILNFNSNFIKI